MEKRMYICISDFDKTGLDKLRPHFDIDALPRGEERPNEEKLKELAKNYDVLVIGTKERMTKEIYKSKQRLETIGTLSVGLDHIDESFFLDNKITILNTPFSMINSVAEHTFALLLSICKNIKEAEKASRELKGRSGMKNRPIELFEKTIGVIGAGNIGKRVMEIASCFKMNILCYTFHPKKHSEIEKIGVNFVSLDELCEKSDFITIHLPLTERSKNMINSNKINMMKTGVIIVNTCRTEIIEKKSFMENLENGKIYAAGLDLTDKVMESYINTKAVLTPHIAGITKESLGRIDNELADAIVKHYSL